MSRTGQNSLQSITFSTTSVVGGATLVGTVHLSGTSSRAAVVTLALNNTTDPCTVPASVTVPAGSTSANFTIGTKAVTKSFTETIWGNYGVTRHAAFTITAGTVQPTASAPTFSPAAGTYASAQSVALASATAGATIYYTTDGSMPTTASTVYSGPISVSVTTTVKAIAAASGCTNSAVGSATYTISVVQPTASTPTFSPAAGTYTSAQSVALATSTSGATIYYTADGSTPTTSSTVYSSPISVPVTTTIKAIAAASGYTNSAMGSALYTISKVAASTPTFSPAAGTYTSAQSVAVATSTSGATIYYTTDGSTPTTSSTVYSGPISVSVTTTIKAIAAASGDTNSAVGSATYTLSASSGGSLAASLGTPSFADSFNYTSSSSSAFTKVWVPQIYSANNYAGAGSNVTMQASNITFPVDPNLGVPCLCLTLNQPSTSASNGGEILSAASLNTSVGLGGYGTYEFYVRFGSSSATPSGAGSAVSGGVSSTFMLSQNNSGTTGYVEIDAPECEGQHPTWAEYDIWFNSDSGGNVEPSGGNFVSQGSGSDSYLPVPTLATGFNYYGFIWSASRIDFYLNGVLQGSLTKNVPQAQTAAGNIPGIDINHYGCNSADWGGKATVGTARYCYVQSAKFWKA